MKTINLKKNNSFVLDDYCIDRQNTLNEENRAKSLNECERLLRTLRSSFDDWYSFNSWKWNYVGIVNYCIQVKSAVTIPSSPFEVIPNHSPKESGILGASMMDAVLVSL